MGLFEHTWRRMYNCKCGETIIRNFYRGNKTTCKQCVSERANERYHNLSEFERTIYTSRSLRRYYDNKEDESTVTIHDYTFMCPGCDEVFVRVRRENDIERPPIHCRGVGSPARLLDDTFHLFKDEKFDAWRKHKQYEDV